MDGSLLNHDEVKLFDSSQGSSSMEDLCLVGSWFVPPPPDHLSQIEGVGLGFLPNLCKVFTPLNNL